MKPYVTPSADPQPLTEPRDVPTFRKLAVSGTVLLSGPLFGAVGTVIGMIGAFSSLAESDGSADPSALAGDISTAMLSTLYGGAFGLAGVLLVSIAIFRQTNRERWFFRCVTALAVLWCVLLFPLGLVVGIYLLIIFWSRKNEFHDSRKNLVEQDASSDR